MKKGALADAIFVAMAKKKDKGESSPVADEEDEDADVSDPGSRGEALVQEFWDAKDEDDPKAAFEAFKSLVELASE